MSKQLVDELIKQIESKQGTVPDARVQAIVNRIVKDLFYTIEEFDVSPSEFWTALNFLSASAPEFGLIAPGLGFERLLDIRMDEAEAKAGLSPDATPRTIEGPLYVAGAPVSTGFARLCNDDEIGEPLVMEGQVFAEDGITPLKHALVEVWHANHLGNYSYFDPSQKPFNLRRSIRTDENGRYSFQSVLPLGYSVPPNGATDTLLKALGRHGSRPAHIHFFVTADGHRKLTTQINIDGDPYLWDDFAFATREGLVPAISKVSDVAQAAKYQLKGEFSHIMFNFVLHADKTDVISTDISRARAAA
ncbi:catechol 1,2-dioxygenase [Alcaligenaceae bacterium]|nr:catechol 1,2-dioxygenase [Alcaligenaceae bacterium]